MGSGQELAIFLPSDTTRRVACSPVVGTQAKVELRNSETQVHKQGESDSDTVEHAAIVFICKHFNNLQKLQDNLTVNICYNVINIFDNKTAYSGDQRYKNISKRNIYNTVATNLKLGQGLRLKK